MGYKTVKHGPTNDPGKQYEQSEQQQEESRISSYVFSGIDARVHAKAACNFCRSGVPNPVTIMECNTQ